MKKGVFLILMLFFSWLKPSYSDDQVIPLELYKALFVEGPENIQPSGLTIWRNDLYAVSDKHDTTIFKIELGHDVAMMNPYLTIKVSSTSDTRSCDFEAITSDDDGNFYLVSETLFRILRVTSDGKEVSWITPSLRPWGEEQQLFKARNAFLEGISYIAPGHFVLCAEREPRGFMEVDITGDSPEVKAYRSDKTKFEFPNGRSPDFSGLYWYDNSLYVLERNACLISELTKNNGRFEEGTGWSYGHIVTSEEYRYSDMQYGKAEGLCMDENYVYVILDNNGLARASDPNDRRPLLLILNRPDRQEKRTNPR